MVLFITKTTKLFCFSLVVSLLTVNLATAQNKVVVIPLGGDDASQYRIAPGSYADPLTTNQGRLEYTTDSSPDSGSLWGGVCLRPGEYYSQLEEAANNICQELGFNGGNNNFFIESSTNSSFIANPDGQNTLYSLDVLSCDDDDPSSFNKCQTTSPQLQQTVDEFSGPCGSELVTGTELGLYCGATQPSLFEKLNFRIVPNTSENPNPNSNVTEGRLEATIGETTGSVCNDNFDFNQYAAVLVCKSLGFESGIVLNGINIDSPLYGVVDASEDTPILIDQLSCPNSFDSNNCTYQTFHDCDHDEDVGVSCSNSD